MSGTVRGNTYVDDARVTTVKALALIVGAVFTLLGIVGFFVTGFDHVASYTGETVLGLAVNPLHNIVHLIIGIAGLAMGWALPSARTYGWGLVVVCGGILIWGLFVAGDPASAGNYLGMNVADNWLLVVTVLVGLVIALMPVRSSIRRDEEVDIREPGTTRITARGRERY